MLKTLHGITHYQSPILEPFSGLVHAFLGRTGGISRGHLSSLNMGRREEDSPENLKENKGRVAKAFAIEAERIFTVSQVHSDRVVIIDRADSTPDGVRALEADGIITNAVGIAIGILTADCVPVLLYDGKKNVAAAVHAGWKGTASRIAVKAVETMIERFECRPIDIYAAIGPAIGPCCYDVGEEVVSAIGYRDRVADLRNGKWFIDLPKANLIQLEETGVSEIDVSNICTSSRTDLFFSHRGEKGKTGRQFSFIALR